MAVTITDLRTVRDGADTTTGWNTGTVFTSEPTPIEATGCLGVQVSTATVDIYHATTAVDLTDSLVYVWVYPRGAMDTLTNGGMSVHLGDGADRIAFHVAGDDVAAFRHEDGPVGWQCLLLDTSNLPSLHTVRAGALATLTLTAITQMGVTFKTLAKSIGGVENCFVDIIRYANMANNDGAVLDIIGGTSVTPGTFSEIAAADRTITNQAAYGVVRELGSGLYGVQGRLRFGNATGTASSWFEDVNVAVAFEDRGVAIGRYGFIIRACCTICRGYSKRCVG